MDYYYEVKPESYLRVKAALNHIVFAARLAEDNDRLFCGYSADQLDEILNAFIAASTTRLRHGDLAVELVP